jgi:hypothetical protein
VQLGVDDVPWFHEIEAVMQTCLRSADRNTKAIERYSQRDHSLDTPEKGLCIPSIIAALAAVVVQVY